MNRRAWIAVLSLLVNLVCANIALAGTVTVKSTPELACLSIIPGKSDQLIYPDDALQRRDGGVVDVDIVFADAKSSPSVKIDYKLQASTLTDAVKDYVGRYRLPCMKPDSEPITLHQSYVFNPNDGRPIVNTVSGDANPQPPDPQLACMMNLDGKIRPEVPNRIVGNSEILKYGGAKYYVQLTFTAADQPPAIEWLLTSSETEYRSSIRRFVSGLRLPCLTKGPVSIKRYYSFNVDQGARNFINDMTLRKFLGLAGDYQKSVSFDLTTMDCPFDLRVTYRQPYDSNLVSELVTSVPSRRPFMVWLANIKLNLKNTENMKLFGDSFTVSVPCGTVDL